LKAITVSSFVVAESSMANGAVLAHEVFTVIVAILEIKF